MLETVKRRRFHLTLRSLMIVVAVCALLLFPLSRSIRQLERVRQARLRAVQEAKLARDLGRKSKAEALRLMHLARPETTVGPAGSRGPDVVTKRAEGASTDDRWRGKVWASLSVNPPSLREGEPTELQLWFTLVNESHERLDPRIFESRIMVDGKELADSARLMGRTPRTSRFQALRPGEGIHFIVPLGHGFEEPGVYRVVWEGTGFRSPEVVIRVRPKRPNDL